jgi:predicted glutamine amidotransferase
MPCARGVKTPLRYAAVLSDGQSLFVIRYSSDDKPPSLYFSRCEGGTVIASEPLQDRASATCPEWTAVPADTALTVCGKDVTQQRVAFEEVALA